MINLSISMFVFFFFSKNFDLRLYRVETITLLSLKFFEFPLNNKYILIKYTIFIYIFIITNYFMRYLLAFACICCNCTFYY